MLRQGDYSLSNLTLHYWIGDPIATVMEGQPGIFKNANFINSLINSLKLTFVNGVFGTIFGRSSVISAPRAAASCTARS